MFLGDDTQADPNDPDAGRRERLGGAADPMSALLTGVNCTFTDTTDLDRITGSADGVPVDRHVDGQLFGPGTGEDEDDASVAVAPSGVAGQFQGRRPSRRLTADDAGPLAARQTAVVGAFGADKRLTLTDDGTANRNIRVHGAALGPPLFFRPSARSPRIPR